MKIVLNGKPARIKPGLTVSDLLIQWRIRAELVTVELDGTILQKLDYDTVQIKEGNKVEFVFYMGGGDLKS
ncbi:MAG: thiamine biosynthesis protein ThiS [Candidatus Omnitrophica bacterium CG1_02_46_14]|nr:MAG: thiamine biosynthesis protein ThiS [Candidatus Omnitrophica bacterium CG1_02_46_14]